MNGLVMITILITEFQVTNDLGQLYTITLLTFGPFLFFHNFFSCGVSVKTGKNLIILL
jgi:hypothetical protein